MLEAKEMGQRTVFSLAWSWVGSIVCVCVCVEGLRQLMKFGIGDSAGCCENLPTRATRAAQGFGAAA